MAANVIIKCHFFDFLGQVSNLFMRSGEFFEGTILSLLRISDTLVSLEKLLLHLYETRLKLLNLG